MVMTLLSYYRNHLGSLVVISFLVAAVVAFEAAALVLLASLAQYAADSEAASVHLGPLSLSASPGELALAAVLSVIISVAFRVLASSVRARTISAWERATRHRIFDGFLSADFAFQSSQRSAGLQEVTSQHLLRASNVLLGLTNVLNTSIAVLILVAGSVLIRPDAAVMLITIGAVLLLLQRPISRRVKRMGGQLADVNVRLGTLFGECAANIRDVNLFHAQPVLMDRLADDTDSACLIRRRSLVLQDLAPTLYHGFGLLIVIGGLAVILILEPDSLAEYGAVALLLIRGLSYGQQLTSHYQSVNHNSAFVRDLFGRLHSIEAARATFGSRRLDQVESIAMRSVSFKYTLDAPPALREIELELGSSGVVGLVGPSGSGKSTLAHLILRLLPPTTGRVLVNGIDASEFSPESWTRMFTLAPQEPRLLHASVRDNIAFFRPNVSDEEVLEAARLVGLHETFSSLPEGYATELGPTMRDLSGGQRQRVGIARALAGKPRVMVLDEPTSALDAESEKWIRDAIRAAASKTLILLITHRDSTISVCDRVIQLANGRIADAEATTAPAMTASEAQ